MIEVTIELTNYCLHECKYCSSKTTKFHSEAKFIKVQEVIDFLETFETIDRINLSGGEPISHPKFYNILLICREFSRDVVVYTNALTHIRYNANVIDGIYVEANLTMLPDVKKLHILKRVKQGREKTRPEVKFSRNFTVDCLCDHKILRPDNSISKTPCNKNDL